MPDFLIIFQAWPLWGRAALLIAIVWLLWLIFGRLLIRAAAIAPLALRSVIRGLYWLMDLPLSILHSRFAGIFIGLDWGWTEIHHSIDNRISGVIKFFCKTKSYFRVHALVLCVVIGALIVLPGLFGLEDKTRGPERIYLQAEKWVIESMPFSK